MRLVGVSELGDLPFVRHQLDPALVLGAWRLDEAVAVVSRRPIAREELVVLTGFGPADDQARLLASLAEEIEPPDRLTLTAATDVVPVAWSLAEVRRWNWMLTSTRPPDPVPDEVVVVDDPQEIDDLIDTAAPDSHARPGTPGIEAWLGWRAGADLLAVGAVVRNPDGSGHLRAVSVAPHARGRGIGRSLSVALTIRALSGRGIASLGVYADNEPALRIYRGLDYEVVHTFTSGRVSDSSITTAVAPSR
ncbi:GNAT family N-acetyltransferase [Nocardioides sp.]|uniref:GNAT family N-acetyltransferase n=1 Tax=Nocardioides sp. TaxID=35761 RepID=UPI002ED45B6B